MNYLYTAANDYVAPVINEITDRYLAQFNGGKRPSEIRAEEAANKAKEQQAFKKSVEDSGSAKDIANVALGSLAQTAFKRGLQDYRDDFKRKKDEQEQQELDEAEQRAIAARLATLNAKRDSSKFYKRARLENKHFQQYQILPPGIRDSLVGSTDLDENVPVEIQIKLMVNGTWLQGTVKGIVLDNGVYANNPLVEEQGVVYQVIPYWSSVSPTNLDAQVARSLADSHIPVKIGKVGIMYWVAIYYDLIYASVILTDFKQTIESLNAAFSQWARKGDALPDLGVRLAEYEVVAFGKDRVPFYNDLRSLATRRMTATGKRALAEGVLHDHDSIIKDTGRADEQLLRYYDVVKKPPREEEAYTSTKSIKKPETSEHVILDFFDD